MGWIGYSKPTETSTDKTQTALGPRFVNRKASRQSTEANKKTLPGLKPRLVATMLLTRVVDDGRNLDALTDREHGLNSYLNLSDPDRALAQAICRTALRNRNRIEIVMKRVADRPPPKNARFLIHSLHVAIAQLLFMDVPDSAAVNLAVGAIGDDKRTVRFKGFANAILRRVERERDDLLARTTEVSPFPKWFKKQLRKGFGREKLGTISAAVDRRAHV